MHLKTPKKFKQSEHNASNFLPNDAHSKHILKQRAELLAQKEIKKDVSDRQVSYIRFRLGENQFYGIPYYTIQEVINKPNITKIPLQPDFIAGVINRHGMLLTVLDLSRFFKIKMANLEDRHIIIINSNDITMAMLVNTIEKNAGYSTGELDPSFTLEGALKPEFILGLHKGTTAIINIEAVLKEIISQLKK